MPGETTDARKRHAEEQRIIDRTLTAEQADQVAITIAGLTVHELLEIRDGLHRLGMHELFRETALARNQARAAHVLALLCRQRAEAAEAELAQANATLDRVREVHKRWGRPNAWQGHNRDLVRILNGVDAERAADLQKALGQ
jgi:hypothetical protein